MKFIKLGLISIVLLSLAVTLISLFFPSRIRISRAVNVKAVPDSIWMHLNNFEEWKIWNPFADPRAEVAFIKDGAEDSNQPVRLGKIIFQWTEKDSLEYRGEIRNLEHRPIQTGWKVVTLHPADSITLQWYMDFQLRWYPWEKFRSLLHEKVYGARMEKGLDNLRQILQR